MLSPVIVNAIRSGAISVTVLAPSVGAYPTDSAGLVTPRRVGSSVSLTVAALAAVPEELLAERIHGLACDVCVIHVCIATGREYQRDHKRV